MLAIRLPEEIEYRLLCLAEQTGQTVEFHLKEAIIKYLDEMEAIFISEQSSVQ